MQKEKVAVNNLLQESKIVSLPSDEMVFDYLQKQKDAEILQEKIYFKVNTFVDNEGKAFIGKETFASQWGTIRSIAMQSKSKELLLTDLFRHTTKEDKEKKINIKEGYLVHGVAAEKWEGKKLNDLKCFIERIEDSIAIEAVVNLAAEMAKKCKENKR
jgi:hypothetical protein